MKTNIQILPGINKIFWLDARSLPPMVAMQSKCQHIISIFTDLNFIQIFDEAECQLASEKENKGSQETATLKFNCGFLVPDNNFLAFVFYDNNGNSYLLGSKERPVSVKWNYRTANQSGDPAGYEYEITHVDIKSMLPCRVFVDD